MPEADEVDDGVEARLVFNEESGLSWTRLVDEIGMSEKMSAEKKT